MIRIAHIINPVKVDPSSDLHTAQPVTFETMLVARQFAAGSVEVSLYSTQFAEDRDFVPRFFKKTKDLERSVLDLGNFNVKRKLPILKDILDRLHSASDAGYFIYTNSDIALMPNFYTSIAKIIKQGHDAFVINRRTIPGHYSKIEDIPLMYSETGEPHKGWDCFIFKRELYSRFELGNVCVGIGGVGRVLIWNLIAQAAKFKEFKNRHLTFHIGNDRIWLNDEYSDYKQFNREEARDALKKINSKSKNIDKLKNYLGTIKIAEGINRQKKKFVFIAGLHRSGTTVLADCLDENPLVSGFADTGVPKDEGQFLQSVFPPAREYGGPGKFGFRKEMHLTEKNPLVNEKNGEKILNQWSRYWDMSKPYLLEKSPPNLLKTRFLQALFPGAYFIVITRHPVATSYATRKWSKTTIDSLLEHWITCHNIFERDKVHLKHLYVLKYEDFVNDPDAFLKEIYDFLGIPADAAASR
ncbi:MAG: sulfotransferase, partial [bacterium]|nr:sulfotransferase [bacterium]